VCFSLSVITTPDYQVSVILGTCSVIVTISHFLSSLIYPSEAYPWSDRHMQKGHLSDCYKSLLTYNTEVLVTVL
jgi:hypothetical protein